MNVHRLSSLPMLPNVKSTNGTTSPSVTPPVNPSQYDQEKNTTNLDQQKFGSDLTQATQLHTKLDADIAAQHAKINDIYTKIAQNEASETADIARENALKASEAADEASQAEDTVAEGEDATKETAEEATEAGLEAAEAADLLIPIIGEGLAIGEGIALAADAAALTATIADAAAHAADFAAKAANLSEDAKELTSTIADYADKAKEIIEDQSEIKEANQNIYNDLMAESNADKTASLSGTTATNESLNLSKLAGQLGNETADANKYLAQGNEDNNQTSIENSRSVQEAQDAKKYV